jgi:pSer/pThr/pTyr-binding forkhead associated (FHA) protein
MNSKTRKGVTKSRVAHDDATTQIIRPSENDQSKAEREESAKMVVIQGNAPGLQILLSRPETTIGRLSDNHLVLDSTTVSRHHGRVIKDGSRYDIEDLKSRNGIAMNGEPLKSHERRALIHGDTLRFGDHQLVFLNPSGFSDPKGISTITFDRDKVTEEVDAVLKRLPLLMKRIPARKADPSR